MTDLLTDAEIVFFLISVYPVNSIQMLVLLKRRNQLRNNIAWSFVFILQSRYKHLEQEDEI